MQRAFVVTFVGLALMVGLLSVPLWNASHAGRAPRVRPSRIVAETFANLLCRPPSDRETVDWDSRPFDRATLAQTLASTGEAMRVRDIRALYVDVLRRDATPADCSQIRAWVDGALTSDAARREVERLLEARRVAGVRRLFIETLGRDPREWDDQALRRWVDSPFTLAEIRGRLRAQRPLVGVHYFAWYQLEGDGWGNGLTRVPPDAPTPAAGRYDSGDTDVMATQIRQMEEAGFDFAIVHVIAESPRTWMHARTFVDRLSGHRLKAAVLLDGLYAADAATKRMWVQKAVAEFASSDHYVKLHGQPLVMLFSALIDFDEPGVILRNVYWTSRYDPGSNSFNPNHHLERRDWTFWAPTPQPLANGAVAAIPGYTDASLGRPQTMVHPRDNGQFYRAQWEHALALHPELILVYSWNEYFEQTGIEPTAAWGNQYVALTACYAAHAHRGTSGSC